MKVFLNTSESLFLDRSGQMFRDGFPRLIVGGHETIEISLKTATPDYGSEEAQPDSWPADSSWVNTDGISAMLTIDSDYIQRLAGSLTQELPSGSLLAVAAMDSDNAADIPQSGVLRLYAANGDYEDITYLQREISGSNVSFTFGTAVIDNYPAGAAMDCKQSPLASCFLNAAASDWKTGKLVFDLAVDSSRLRRETEYSNSATIAIPGMELLLFQTTADSITRKIKAFLFDSVSLWKTQGDPGNPAPVPDAQKDQIAAEIQKQLENFSPDVSAADIIISAESEFYGGMDVEGALQEIGAQLQSHGEAIEGNAQEIEKLKQASGGVTAGEAAALALVFG